MENDLKRADAIAKFLKPRMHDLGCAMILRRLFPSPDLRCVGPFTVSYGVRRR